MYCCEQFSLIGEFWSRIGYDFPYKRDYKRNRVPENGKSGIGNFASSLHSKMLLMKLNIVCDKKNLQL